MARGEVLAMSSTLTRPMGTIILCGVVCAALAMGLRTGWPLLLLSSVSGLTKLGTLWQFRWARVSPQAQDRRLATQEAVPVVPDFTP